MVQPAGVAGQLHLIFAAEFRKFPDDVHDLAGIDVHPPVDDHVIRAAEDAVVPRHGKPAGAGAGDDPREVVGAVAQQRHGLLAEGCHHHFPHLAIGHGFKGLRVQHLDDEEVRPVVESAVGVAVHGRAGSVHLRHARDVVAPLQAELALDGKAHLFAAGLGAADDLAQPELPGESRAFRLFGEEQGHGGRGAEAGSAHVGQELEVHFQIARSHRDGEHAEKLAAELEARPRCPESVAHGHLHAVGRGKSGQFIAARHLEAEGLDVAPGIGEDLALAGGAAGGVDARDLLLGHAEQGQRIAPAQVFHIREREAAQVVQAADVAGSHAAGVEQGAVLRRVARLGHGPAQAVELDLPEALRGEVGDEAVLGAG